MTRLRAGQTGVPIPTRVSDFSFPILSVTSLMPTQPHIHGVPRVFHGDKRLGCDADTSLSSNAKFKN